MTILGALVGFFLLSGGAQAPSLPPVPALPSYSVTLTGYNAVPAQTDGDPLVTASGAYSNPEVVAARSRDLADELPFGTIIAIEGPQTDGNSCGYHVVGDEIGYRVIADTMNARYTDRVDVLFSTRPAYTASSGRKVNAGTVLGVCDGVTIRVVGHLDISDPANLPKTQAALRALVSGAAKLALDK